MGKCTLQTPVLDIKTVLRESDQFETIVYAHFHGRPFHTRHVHSQWEVEGVLAEFRGNVLCSEADWKSTHQITDLAAGRFLVRTETGALCQFWGERLCVWADSMEHADHLARELHERFGKKSCESHFYVIENQIGELYARRERCAAIG